MWTNWDSPFLEYLLGLLPRKFNVLLHVAPEGGADVDQPGSVLGALLLPVPENIQILLRGLSDCFIVGGCGAERVPFQFPIVVPNIMKTETG